MVLSIVYPLNEAASPSAVDIVAIHGLGGDAIDTWTHPKSKAFWLKDFLPQQIPDARIMTFGYNAAAAFGQSTAEVIDHAKGLLSSLVDKREEPEENQRPLIFIAHSLGGIVVKQALLQARLELRYQAIKDTTLGIIFLGTPHRGSEKATYGKVLANVAQFISYRPSSRLMTALETNSDILLRLTSDFRHQLPYYQICSFYEQRPMKPFSGLIVEKYSALLEVNHEEQIPVDADHSAMCKFETDSDDTYEKVYKRIKRMRNNPERIASEQSVETGSDGSGNEKTYFRSSSVINPIENQKALKRTKEGRAHVVARRRQFTENIQDADTFLESGFMANEQKCLRSLFLTNPADRKNALKRKKGDRADGTCEWILKTEELTHWLEGSENEFQNGSNIFWLHGNPGTGKSTMVIAMTDELPKQSVFTNGNKVLAYFFCDSSEPNQRTAISILRGLLYQLIHQCPKLIKYLLAKYLDRKETLFTSFDALWIALMEMSADSSCEIYCMIDALDECEPDSQQTLLRQIYQSFARREAGASLSHGPHILITSRPYPEIRENLSHFHCKDLASYSAVKQDIKIMIDEKVHDLSKRKNYPKRVIEEVSRILKEKAEGTFLWVGIACGELDRPQVQARNAVQTLRKMPRGLYALYDQLLRTALTSGDGDNDEVTMQMLKCVISARRPLTVPELTALCHLYPEHDENSRLQFTRDLIASCRLMIVIQDERVQLLHKSMKDFLVKEQQKVNEDKAHAELADQCISHMLCYLELPSTLADGAFVKYAVKYWPEHAELAGNNFVIKENHEAFFKLQSTPWALWMKEYNLWVKECIKPRGVLEWLPKGFCVFHAAARWGIVPLIFWALAAEMTDSDLSSPVKKTYDDKCWETICGITPLEEAAKQGKTTIVKVLMESLGSGANLGEQVVRVAARNDQSGKDIMTLLLDRRGDQVRITENVVVAAAWNGQSGKDIMTLLLDRRGDQVQITEKVVQAAARNWVSGKDIMTLLLDRRGDQVRITENVVVTAARNGQSRKDVMTLLLDRRGDQVQITEKVVQAAAENWVSGKDIMTLLLDRRGDQVRITENVVVAAAENDQSGKDIVTLLLGRRGDQVQITEKVVQAAAKNRLNGKDIMTTLLDRQGDQIQITQDAISSIISRFDSHVMKLLLDRLGDQIQITEIVVEAAAGNWHSGQDIMTLLLDRRGDQIQITEKVIQAAAENWNTGYYIMKLLLDRREDQSQITEKVVKTAARNEWSGNKIMSLLLDRRGDQIQITKKVIEAAVGNNESGKDIITLLLSRQTDQIQITEKMIEIAARNWNRGKDIITLLLDQREDQIQISEKVVEVAAAHLHNGKDIMTLLLDRRGDQIQIIEKVVQAAAGNWLSGQEVMTLLLRRRGDQIQITEKVVVAAAGNWLRGKEIITLLLNQREDKIQITEKVVEAAVRNWHSGQDIMSLLLDRRGDQIQITEKLVQAAAENWNNGYYIMKLLLDRREDQSQITEKVVKAAARNEWSGNKIMSLLLDRRGDQIQITEEVVKAAAGNNGSGIDIMTLLLNRQGDQIPITEEVVKAAAENWKTGYYIMKLLLDRREDQIPITEKLVQAAAENWNNGYYIMKLLLDRREDQIQITQDAIIKIVDHFDSGIVTLLLDRPGDQIQITEDAMISIIGRFDSHIVTLLLDRQGDRIRFTEKVVEAAAGNWVSGKDIMTLILHRQRDRVQITEKVFKAAARNGRSGKDIMTLLLDLQGDQIQITEKVVQAAAGNWLNGKDIMILLLERQGDQIPITEKVVQAATGNWLSGKDIMKLLLDRRKDQIQITEKVIEAAVGNGGSGIDIMKLLLDRQEGQVQVTEKVVQAAAGNWVNGKEIVTLLLDQRGDKALLSSVA